MNSTVTASDTAHQISPLITSLQRLAFELPLGQPLGIKAETWFETATKRIDLMGDVEEALGNEVGELAIRERDLTARATHSMQQTLDKAQAGARNIGRAGDLLAEIAEGVSSISDRNIQIASAGAQQTAVTSQELARLAEYQQELVGRFKIA